MILKYSHIVLTVFSYALQFAVATKKGSDMGKKKASKSVPKIGIYLPAHRVADVEKWRDRINFSELFWTAFDKEISLMSSVNELKGQEFSNVVTRLQQQASVDHENGRKLGMEYGEQWAKDDAGRDEMRRIATDDPAFGDVGETVEYLEGIEWFDWRETLQQHEPDDSDAFCQGFEKGFQEGARIVWDAIKNVIG